MKKKEMTSVHTEIKLHFIHTLIQTHNHFSKENSNFFVMIFFKTIISLKNILYSLIFDLIIKMVMDAFYWQFNFAIYKI